VKTVAFRHGGVQEQSNFKHGNAPFPKTPVLSLSHRTGGYELVLFAGNRNFGKSKRSRTLVASSHAADPDAVSLLCASFG
jgi:hypothetical protein